MNVDTYKPVILPCFRLNVIDKVILASAVTKELTGQRVKASHLSQESIISRKKAQEIQVWRLILSLSRAIRVHRGSFRENRTTIPPQSPSGLSLERNRYCNRTDAPRKYWLAACYRNSNPLRHSIFIRNVGFTILRFVPYNTADSRSLYRRLVGSWHLSRLEAETVARRDQIVRPETSLRLVGANASANQACA